MSLQGSLDTFALPDVLVLLASTKKSGELHVAGSRTPGSGHPPAVEGRVRFDAGAIVGTDVPRATEPADAVFELLRLADGTFSFLAGSAPAPQPPADVDGVLAEAQARLAEWREIEAVVPSLDAWLELAPEPPTAHVSMRADQWRLVVAVAAGCPVGSAIGRLGLADPGCRAVKELVEGGLVSLSTEAAPSTTTWPAPAAEPVATAAPDPVADPEPTVTFHVPDPEPAYDDEPVEDGTAYETGDTAFADTISSWDQPATGWESEEAPAEWAGDEHAVVPGNAFTPDDAQAEDVPDWRAELGDLPDLDAVANLPSRSRRRAEGAAGSDSQAAAPAGEYLPDDEEHDGEEPLNRGLLLKFLSSVRN